MVRAIFEERQGLRNISLMINIYFLFCRTNSVRDLIFCLIFVHGQPWSCGKAQHAEVKEIYINRFCNDNPQTWLLCLFFFVFFFFLSSSSKVILRYCA
jgi:hypothetical protein